MSSLPASCILPKQCRLPGALTYHVVVIGLHGCQHRLRLLDQECHGDCIVGPHVAHKLQNGVGFDTKFNELA